MNSLTGSEPPVAAPGGNARLIAEVGELRASFDLVRIVSSTAVGTLKARLPIHVLLAICHRFSITTYQGKDPRLRSVVTIICAQGDLTPLQALAEHAAVLGSYRITEVELAFDVIGEVPADVGTNARALVKLLGKVRHRRRHLRSLHNPGAVPPPGCVSEPTFYFEGRKSKVGLKVYVRHRKLPRGAFGDEHTRLEWTLRGKRAITCHLGGTRLGHLLAADPGAFLKRNLRLEEIDYERLGRIFRRPPKRRRNHVNPRASVCEDDNYWARRAAFLALRILAIRELEQERHSDWDLALAVSHSPAQIRGYLKELRDGRKPPRRPGRPRKAPQYPRRVTDYLIDRCFRRIKPTRV